MNPKKNSLFGVIVLATLAAPLGAQEASRGPWQQTLETTGEAWDSLQDALKHGRMWLAFRYRYENVDSDAFSKEAHASTLRTALGYESGRWGGFAGLVEFEDVTVIGNDLYNSTTNGVTDRPVVADPDGTEINQAYLSYLAEDWGSKLGRQIISLDNERFVGTVAWRQNWQTFDAVSFDVAPDVADFYYGYVAQVNRVVGEDNPRGDVGMKSHLFNISHEFEGTGHLSVYDYYLDYDEVNALSTNSLGARFAGKPAINDTTSALFAAEFAHQVDVGDNPNDVSASYFHAEGGANIQTLTFKVGYELLEGSGDPGDAFQTPLATLHKFNGWADRFLLTPVDGLQDLYLHASWKFSDGKGKLAAIYHDFQADSSSLDYGSEIDAEVTWAANEKVTFGLTFANYMADDFASDTQILWFWLRWNALSHAFVN